MLSQTDSWTAFYQRLKVSPSLLAVQPLEEGDKPKILCEFVTQVSHSTLPPAEPYVIVLSCMYLLFKSKRMVVAHCHLLSLRWLCCPIPVCWSRMQYGIFCLHHSIKSQHSFVKHPHESLLCNAQAAFNFMSCGAVAMAKMYAGSDAALTMGLIMGAHMVSHHFAAYPNLHFAVLLDFRHLCCCDPCM